MESLRAKIDSMDTKIQAVLRHQRTAAKILPDAAQIVENFREQIQCRICYNTPANNLAIMTCCRTVGACPECLEHILDNANARCPLCNKDHAVGNMQVIHGWGDLLHSLRAYEDDDVTLLANV